MEGFSIRRHVRTAQNAPHAVKYGKRGAKGHAKGPIYLSSGKPGIPVAFFVCKTACISSVTAGYRRTVDSWRTEETYITHIKKVDTPTYVSPIFRNRLTGYCLP